MKSGTVFLKPLVDLLSSYIIKSDCITLGGHDILELLQVKKE